MRTHNQSVRSVLPGAPGSADSHKSPVCALAPGQKTSGVYTHTLAPRQKISGAIHTNPRGGVLRREEQKIPTRVTAPADIFRAQRYGLQTLPTVSTVPTVATVI